MLGNRGRSDKTRTYTSPQADLRTYKIVFPCFHYIVEMDWLKKLILACMYVCIYPAVELRFRSFPPLCFHKLMLKLQCSFIIYLLSPPDAFDRSSFLGPYLLRNRELDAWLSRGMYLHWLWAGIYVHRVAALADVHSLELFDRMSRAAYRVVKKSRARRPAGRCLGLPNLACAVAGSSCPIRSYL